LIIGSVVSGVSAATADFHSSHTDAKHKTHHKIKTRTNISSPLSQIFDEEIPVSFRFCFIGHDYNYKI
jgi:hypothetical protein